ncbi:MAG TPA: AAA family ATPase [Acetobacteraceae bacterium]|nr:AAA family ATPase [Acetobacteraceae bacterium]
MQVLAFVADDDTETALRGGLLNTVEHLEIRRGTILHAIRHLAKEPTPRALIVDISEVENPLYELDNLASVCSPDVTVMVIGEGGDISFYRELVRNIGVAEYLHKPLTRDHVSRMFAPHIGGVAADAGAPRGGSVIAVCGARGGVGSTTIAVNLALQLSGSTRGHVALLDLHLSQGTTALMLGVKVSGGLRVALEQPDRADALFLDRVCVDINERLRLVAADEPLDAMPAPTPEGVRRVLELLRRRFNYIVMDMPMPRTAAELQALRTARHLITVMTPDLAGIRDVDRLRQLSTSLGAPHATIVLNRMGMPGGLKLPLIEQGLGTKPSIVIPELGKQLARAANLGKPALGECAPFSKGIALLAQEVSGAAARHSGHSSLLDRIFRR